MAISGSVNLTASAADIIKEALETVGGIDENGTPTTDQYASALRTLNYMVKSWQSDEVNLFGIQKLTLFLALNQNKYSLGPSGDNFTTSFLKTQTAVAAAATDTTITVDDAQTAASADYIGIELDDGTMQWTTINGAPAANVITLTDALTGAVAVDNHVYIYTTKGDRPMKILRAALTTYAGSDTEVDVEPLDKYISYTEKTSDGQIVSVYYDPQITTGYLYVWPESDSVTDRLTLWVQRSLSDLDVTTDDMDYPQEWFMALSLGLAVLLANKYGLSRAEKQDIMIDAGYYMELARGGDRDPYTEIIPDFNPGEY